MSTLEARKACLEKQLDPDRREELLPEVGMGITVCYVNDSYPGTIVKVTPSGKTFWYTEDETFYQKLATGKTIKAFKPRTNGHPIRASLRKRGEYRNERDIRIHLGRREHYRCREI